jgi:hypothetical protein
VVDTGGNPERRESGEWVARGSEEESRGSDFMCSGPIERASPREAAATAGSRKSTRSDVADTTAGAGLLAASIRALLVGVNRTTLDENELGSVRPCAGGTSIFASFAIGWNTSDEAGGELSARSE